MKKIVLAILLLMTIIGLGVWEQYFISKSFDTLSAKADEILYLSENGENEKALALAKETADWWAKEEDVLELISPHNEIKDVIIYVSEVEGVLDTDNPEEVVAKITILKELCKSRKNLLAYKLKNIF